MSATLLAAQLITAGASLVVNVLSARALGPEGRGTLALFLQLAYVVSAVSLLGIDRSYPALTHAGAAPRWNTAYREIIRYAILGLLFVPLLMVGAAIFSISILVDVQLVVALALFTVANAAFVALRSSAAAAGSGRAYVVSTIACQAFLVVGATASAYWHISSTSWWLWIYGISAALPCMAAFFRPQHRGSSDARGPSRAHARTFGLRLLPAVVGNIIMLRSDRIFLPVLSSVEQLGLYVVVATLTELLVWPIQGYVDGHLSRWATDGRNSVLRVSHILVRVTGYAIAATFATGLIAKAAVIPLFGPAYAESLSLVWTLAVASGLYAVSRCGLGLVVALGSSRWATFADVGGMVVAICLLVALAPVLGAQGAAWSSLAGYGFSALTSLITLLWLSAKSGERTCADASVGEAAQTRGGVVGGAAVPTSGPRVAS